MRRVKYLDEGEMDFLRDHYEWGEVWFDEAARTLGHIQEVRWKCKILTQSPAETGADFRDRMVAQQTLAMLDAEAMRVLKECGRKRVRKRGAALRHRANAIFNQFEGKVVGRMVEELKAYTGHDMLDSMRWAFSSLSEGPVLFYPHAIIKPYIP